MVIYYLGVPFIAYTVGWVLSHTVAPEHGWRRAATYVLGALLVVLVHIAIGGFVIKP